MTRPLNPPSLGALVLAVAATGTAVCVSVLAGWQRGGWLAERLVWVATGVVLVIGAHLLPALSRSAPPIVRSITAVLWAACMVAASYGYATFFLLSQQHAGDVRVATVAALDQTQHRSLTVVMAERAQVTAALARAEAPRCIRDCTTLGVRRVALAAKLEALDSETEEVRRLQSVEDRTAARRDALHDDPVTSRLGAVLGIPPVHLDLFAGLASAAVLEAVACLLWWLVCQSPKPAMEDAVAVTKPVTEADASIAMSRPSGNAAIHVETEVTKLARDVAAGLLRPTVTDIRRHLACSQAKAATLRRQIVGLTP